MDKRYFEETDLSHEDAMKPSVSGYWSERIFVITEDYEIKGFVFMPKTGRKNRMLSDILNGERRFVAIKDAEVHCRKSPVESDATYSFIQLNLDSIILIRPCKEG